MLPSVLQTDIATTCVIVAFFMSVLFMVVYTACAKWWKSEIGWARISMDFCIALALSPDVIHYIFGIVLAFSPVWIWYTITAVALVAATTAWNIWLVLKYQRIPSKLKKLFSRA